MKLKKFAVLIGSGFAVAAHAQSSVTVYGLIDSGVMYTSNVGGKSVFSIDPDSQAPDLVGLKGQEDLGGGVKAVFQLENQFNMNNGATVNGMFGHQAWVGLQSDQYGKLTMGNQIDFMFDSLVVNRWGWAFPIVNAEHLQQSSFQLGDVRIPGNQSFDFDRLLGSGIPNAVKYQSPTIGGLSGGAMYSFGGVAGSFGQHSAQSYGLNYAIGSVRLNGAYTYVKSINNGNDGIRNYGAGAAWDITPGTQVAALYTNTTNTQTGGRISVYEADASHAFSQSVLADVSYQYQKGNSELNRQHVNQETVTLLYALSRRSSIYATAAFQQASGGPAWVLMASGPSSGSSQVVTSLGLIHSF